MLVNTGRSKTAAFALLIFAYVLTGTLQYEIEESSVWYRPSHFLYVFLVLVVLVTLADPKAQSNSRKGITGLGLTVLAGGLLWISELAFDFRLGFFTAVAVYLIPGALYGVYSYVHGRAQS